jgi:hypothetical protein
LGPYLHFKLINGVLDGFFPGHSKVVHIFSNSIVESLLAHPLLASHAEDIRNQFGKKRTPSRRVESALGMCRTLKKFCFSNFPATQSLLLASSLGGYSYGDGWAYFSTNKLPNRIQH